MHHKTKNFVLIKSEDDAGTISGYFSTYDRIPDSYGDVVAPGAFTDTIKAREESGHKFPLCWNHDLNQIIGQVDSIEDTEKGPLMTASFFNTPLAQEKREIVKSGVVYQFSFAYDVREASQVTLEDGTKANELQKLDLFEVSIAPVPANPRAEVTDIKAGRRNSAKDADELNRIFSLADEIKAAVKGLLGEIDTADDPEDGEDKAKANAAAEELEPSNPTKDRLLKYIDSLREEEKE